MTLPLLAVIGTRPEAIKMAPLVQALRAHGGFALTVVATGQHAELLDDALAVFGIEPDGRLPAGPAGESLAQSQARLLAALDETIARCAPALVVAQGDTLSCLAAAWAAFYRGVPFAHVEAGLRSGRLAQPFPEEAQRQVADRLATLHFAPTRAAARVLRRELPQARQVHAVGNTGIDALLAVAARPSASVWERDGAPQRLLVTMHRRESHGAPLASICAALRLLAARDDVQIVLPVHPNPAVAGAVRRELGGLPRLALHPPLDYPQMVATLRDATLLLTDSGGLQEEAPALGVPVLVLRDCTERPEGVAAGTARLVGTDTETIARAAAELLDDAGRLEAMRRRHFPYGDGQASARIVRVIADWAAQR